MTSMKTLLGVCLVILSSNPVLSQLRDNCRTPDNRPGRCVPLRECTLLYTLMRRVIRHRDSKFKGEVDRYESRSQCGVEEGQGPLRPLVCCPLPRDPPDVSTHANLHRINFDRCGRDGTHRVFNGQAAGLTQYRWMVLLAYRLNQFVRFRCGGTLINERYVLTAAHCLTDDKDLVFVRLGEYDMSKQEDCDQNEDDEDPLCLDPPFDVDVEKKIRHPNYNKTPLGSDIGLIRLNQTVELKTISINTICLPVSHYPENIGGENMTVTGWGHTIKGHFSSVLMKADVPVMPIDKCHAVYKSMFNYTIDETMICAGDHRDSCKGDSGGPLMMNTESRMFQFGVVSYGHQNCGTPGVPGVYTKVSYYMDWILDQLK